MRDGPQGVHPIQRHDLFGMASLACALAELTWTTCVLGHPECIAVLQSSELRKSSELADREFNDSCSSSAHHHILRGTIHNLGAA